MKTEIISKIWANRKPIAEIATTTFVVGKGVIDFARKDGIGKLFALAELGLGIGAAAIHTGIADKVVATVAESRAAADYRTYPPNENPDGEPYDPEDDENYDPEWDAGWDTIDTGIEPENNEDEDENDEDEETPEEE